MREPSPAIEKEVNQGVRKLLARTDLNLIYHDLDERMCVVLLPSADFARTFVNF
jgi:hypothetical protein